MKHRVYIFTMFHAIGHCLLSMSVENNTDHLCVDTRLNVLAPITSLGHVTPF